MTADTMATEMTVGRVLCATTPWFRRARLELAPGGWTAFVRLDHNMAKERAGTQSLADASLAEAAKNARRRRPWDDYVPGGQRDAASAGCIVALALVLQAPLSRCWLTRRLRDYTADLSSFVTA